MATRRIKLLICFVTLALITGCVPSFMTPTPIPPLDPNAINLIIVQTADAASTQTVAALPTFTPTATFTPTPRNTYTPSATLTPIQTFVLPSPTPLNTSIYYRVKHDDQLAIYNYKSRSNDENSEGVRRQTPETVPLFVLPKLTSGTLRTSMDGPWETYFAALNNNDEGDMRYMKNPETALFNTAGFPQMQSLTMGGNILTLVEIQGEWGRVNTMAYTAPPSALTVNYVTRPDLVHKFVVVGWDKKTKSTVIVYPPRGDLYWPLVTKRAVWIQMERLEKFPGVPLVVTANRDLYIQPEPGPTIEETQYKVSDGQSVKIIQYHPSGSNVWGRLQSGGWIPLLWYRVNGSPNYYTSWEMETLPPPPPQK